MSVTFFVEGLTSTYKVPSSHYNPEEPEEPIYNPRYEDVDLYPSLNLSVFNAAAVLRLYGIIGSSEGVLAEVDQLDEYISITEKWDTFSLTVGIANIARYKEKLKELLYIAKSQKKRVVYA